MTHLVARHRRMRERDSKKLRFFYLTTVFPYSSRYSLGDAGEAKLNGNVFFCHFLVNCCQVVRVPTTSRPRSWRADGAQSENDGRRCARVAPLARHKAVVEEEVFLDRQLRVATLEVTGAVVDDKVGRDMGNWPT